MFDGIFEVEVGVNVNSSGRSQRSVEGATFVRLRRKGRRDRIWRGREAAGGFLGWKGSRRHSSESVLSSPEVVARLRYVDRLRPSS
jgi:hypothetical protein